MNSTSNSVVADEEIRKEVFKLNRKVLQRIYPKFKDILTKVSHSVIYELDKASKIWHACEIVGPLFLVKFKDDDDENALYIVVMNQKSRTNYIEKVTSQSTLHLKSDENFIFINTPNGNIKGIWTSNLEELKNLYKRIIRSFIF